MRGENLKEQKILVISIQWRRDWIIQSNQMKRIQMKCIKIKKCNEMKWTDEQQMKWNEK